MMDMTVGFRRTDPRASPAALVAAWLMDALGGTASIELSRSEEEIILLGIEPPEAQLPVRRIVRTALAEERFAGCEVARE